MSNNIKRYTTEEYVNEKITENRTHYIENHFTKYDYFTYSDERTAELDPVEGWFTDWSFWCCLVDENPLDYDNIIGSKVLVRDTI